MKTLTLIPTAALVLGGWIFVAHEVASDTTPLFQPEPAAHAPYDPSAIDRNIAFHQARVQVDPQGPMGWAMLAEAWLARSRESDMDTAAWESEAAARRSLTLRKHGNPRAQKVLVESLLEQHRFMDALAMMRVYSIRSPMYADALIEVGRYNDARRVILEQPVKNDPTVLAVSARLALVEGRPEEALALLDNIRAALVDNPGVPNTALAWYDVKAGDAHLATGNLKEARRRYHAALDLYPASYKASLGLARLAQQEGRWADVETYARLTLQTANSLDARALLGNAARAQGDDATARRWYAECRTMFLEEEATFERLGKGGELKVKPIDRQFATFCAEQGLFRVEGTRAAKRDHANRPDPAGKANLRVLEKA